MAEFIKINRQDCMRLMVEHVPRDDITYQPDQDSQGNPTLPVQVENSIRIKPPSEIAIPIQLDLKKYLGVKPQETTQNHQNIINNLTQLNQITQTVQQQNMQLQALAQQIANNITTLEAGQQQPATIQQLFAQNRDTLQQALEKLDVTYGKLQHAGELLTQNTAILKRQFNPYEEDPLILDRNRTFQSQSLSSLAQYQANLTNTLTQVEQVEKGLSSNLSLLDQIDVGTALPTSEEREFNQLFQELHKKTIQLNQDLQSSTEVITHLQPQLTEMGVVKNNFLKEASLGHVIMKNDGRLYFNDQPLFDQDTESVKNACRQLLRN